MKKPPTPLAIMAKARQADGLLEMGYAATV